MSNISDIRSKLKDNALFVEFTALEFGELIDLLDQVSVKDGEVVVRQDEPGDCMYIVVDGEVRVVHHRGTRDIALATLRSGDFFGEIALVDSGPRSADVIANTDSTLLRISSSAVEELSKDAPQVANMFLRRIGQTLSARMRANNRRLADFARFA